MITTDTHSHTLYSHAADTVEAMAQAARAAGLKVFGFTEHSPRPEGCDYPFEYRERLAAGFPSYIREVQALKASSADVDFLLGLEVDWIDGEEAYIRNLVAQHPYDYHLGSVHFLGHWPVDAGPEFWADLTPAQCGEKYVHYFSSLTDMANSGIMHMAAHPDIIKIFTVDTFRQWLTGENVELVKKALLAMRDNGMSMEISAAGLRKPCKEIYPGPVIMALARDMGLPVTFASDAHAVAHVGWQFDTLAEYARSYGYRTARYFKNKQPVEVAF